MILFDHLMEIVGVPAAQGQNKYRLILKLDNKKYFNLLKYNRNYTRPTINKTQCTHTVHATSIHHSDQSLYYPTTER